MWFKLFPFKVVDSSFFMSVARCLNSIFGIRVSIVGERVVSESFRAEATPNATPLSAGQSV